MILPSTQSILNSNFQGHDRAIAFGIWGATIGGVAAIGPLLGGWLTTYLSWRWAFFINVPVGFLALAGTLRYIGESRDEGARPGFDLPGFLLITFGLGAFVFGLIEGRTYGWWAPANPLTVLGWRWPFTSTQASRASSSSSASGNGQRTPACWRGRRGRPRRRSLSPESDWVHSGTGVRKPAVSAG